MPNPPNPPTRPERRTADPQRWRSQLGSLLLLPLLFTGAAMSLAATPAPAPVTAPANDPWLWLEDVGGERALAWVKERNAESQAERTIPMTMADWAKKLDAFLQFNERDLLDHPGKVTAEIAKAFAESEFEKYRIVQDRLFESDFDRAIKQLPKEGKKP